MQLTISEETRGRIERMAKMSGRTPERSWTTLSDFRSRNSFAHATWAALFMAGVLQYAVVTTPPAAPQKPLQVERYDTYVAFDEQDGSWL